MIFSRFKWRHDKILELSDASCAYIYSRHTRLNLLNGFHETFPFKNFLRSLDQFIVQDRVRSPRVYHFYYEFGLILAGLGHTVEDDAPLVMELVFENKKLRPKRGTKINSIKLQSLERPTWSEYKEAFQLIQEELLNGNCYQVNLTYPFDFETKEFFDPTDLSDFFFSRPGTSAYSHVTVVHDEVIVSNSPECLFQYRDNEIFTMPIKGTHVRGKNWRNDWKILSESPKEEGELNMITDLLRNDLNRLERPRAQVIKSSAPLFVPGLLHQYSLISVKLVKPLSLYKTLEALFPGGSVTGAPKKRVMEIIQKVERFQRGIYCGSTLLCLDDKKVANINIRTASLSAIDRLWRYGAGGGITLLSRANLEFQEMEAKVASFLTLLYGRGQ
jgi:para-aminobenzoate synthetase component 1